MYITLRATLVRYYKKVGSIWYDFSYEAGYEQFTGGMAVAYADGVKYLLYQVYTSNSYVRAAALTENHLGVTL